MTLVHRVLYPEPITSLTEYLARGGGAGLEAAREKTPDELIAEIDASGLRGRGGAGFPTGRKWRTIADFRDPAGATSVVVNGAEGEPGTFKDRTILLTNPYAVIEGALIAARAVGADTIVFGLKRSFTDEVARLERALAEVGDAGWTDGLSVRTFEGPNEYLYGEETALLETIDGRYPFPRIAPPWRRGEQEVVETGTDARSGSGQSAHVEMAGADTGAEPTLVDNVETIANVARIIARGAAWFRTEGTDESPGTIVCTVTGDVVRPGVGEVIMGTPLREVIEAVGGGARDGRTVKAVLSGVSNAVLTADQLDAPVSYEGLAAVGGGLGSAGFIVFDDTADMAAVAAGVSRFLAVESCGQCTPCKQDGVAISRLLDRLCASDSAEADVAHISALVSTVANGARCFLASQHQVVVESILARFPAEVAAHAEGRADPVEPLLVAELVSIDDDGVVVLDERHRDKQPDWSYDATDSGAAPADRFGEHRDPQPLPE
ncbi:MAG: NADH-quinone oxidoreductase subunit NuoF [Acidimicrobiales bacterium]